MEFRYRIISRIVFTALTPIKVGAGNKSLVSDEEVRVDANGLPFIPGSSLAGLLRQGLEEEEANRLFGDQEHGANTIVSDANLVYEGGRVVEGLLAKKTQLLNAYDNLPIRQHVRISHTGAAERSGKFDEQVVFAGSRFCFEMEILGKDKPEIEAFTSILSHIRQQTFRIGGGSRKGLGEIKIERIRFAKLDLNKDLELYLRKTSSLNDDSLAHRMEEIVPIASSENNNWESIHLELKPNDYFLFGSGFGDDKSDITPVYEQRVVWEGDKPELSKRVSVIPATSLKGAIAHRTAYHYNKLKKHFADDKNLDLDRVTGANNFAVRQLFGWNGDNKHPAARGKVLVSDVYLENVSDKMFNHVVIDKYTGGSLDGGLFKETVLSSSDSIFIDIMVDKSAYIGDDDVEKSFKLALENLCNGFLPLGGGVNRGHGIFKEKPIQ